MFGGWDEAEVVEEASVVVPVDPFQRCELEAIEACPGAAVSEGFGLVETDDRFGQGIVVGVAALSWSREQMACSSAARARSVLRDRDAFQPTMRRL